MEHAKRYDMTVPQVATRTGMTEETIRRWARTGVLPGQRLINKQWVFCEEDVNLLPVRSVETLGE